MLIYLLQISVDVLNDCIMAWTQEAQTVEAVGRLTGLNWGFFIFWRDLQISRDCVCTRHPIPQFHQDLLLYISGGSTIAWILVLFIFFSNSISNNCNN